MPDPSPSPVVRAPPGAAHLGGAVLLIVALVCAASPAPAVAQAPAAPDYPPVPTGMVGWAGSLRASTRMRRRVPAAGVDLIRSPAAS